MKKEEVQKLRHGLYRVFWGTGGSSLAAVGSDEHGDRWLAPTNWIFVPSQDWSDVLSVELIAPERDYADEGVTVHKARCFRRGSRSMRRTHGGWSLFWKKPKKTASIVKMPFDES